MYLKFFLKPNTAMLSVLLAGLEAAFLFPFMLGETSLQREDQISEERGCVLSAQVWNKWIEPKNKILFF